MFSLFHRNDQKLGKEDVPLGSFIRSYKHCSYFGCSDSDVIYLGNSREVHSRVVLPGGPQGYTRISVPESIKTRNALLKYLKRKHGYRLKHLQSVKDDSDA